MKKREDTIHVRLSPAQMDVLDECVRISNQTRSEIIREAFQLYILPLYDRLKGLEERRKEQDALV